MQAALKLDVLDRTAVDVEEEIFEIDPIFDADIPDLTSSRTLNAESDATSTADAIDDVLSQPMDLKVRLHVAVPAANDSGDRQSGTSEAAGEPSLAKRVMWGRLEELSLADVVQALAANRSSGRLAVRTELGEGEIFFANGVLASARMGALHGIAALARLLAALEGDFEVRALAVVQHPSMLGEAAPVLLEAMQQLDEAKRLSDEMPGTSHVLVVREGADFAAIERDDAAFAVADLFFEPTSIARARRLDSLGDLHFFAGLLRLWQGGLISDTGRREILSRQTALPMDAVLPVPPLREMTQVQAEPPEVSLESDDLSQDILATSVSDGLRGAKLAAVLLITLFGGIAMGVGVAFWWFGI